jgi:hypothetical protein
MLALAKDGTNRGYKERHCSWVRPCPHDSGIEKRKWGRLARSQNICARILDGGSETNNDEVYDGISVLNVLVDVYRERVAHHGLKEEI